MEIFFFDSWQSILRTLIITILAYTALVVILRNSGKRSLSKMNAFDFIVTVALGSTLSAVALDKNIALADGVLAFLVLIMLQFLVAWRATINGVRDTSGCVPLEVTFSDTE